jgi:HEAT repeat protein
VELKNQREHAIEALVRLRSVAGTDFRDRSAQIILRDAVEVLASLPKEDTPFLLDLLRATCAKAHEDSREILVCGAICLALGKRGDREAVPLLCQILTDPIAGAIREDIAETLGGLRNPAATPCLIQVLGDKEVWVRAKAALSLGEIGDRRAVASLIALLKDESATVREAAVEALAALGNGDACKALIETLESDEDCSVRVAAAEAIGECPGDAGTAALTKIVAYETEEDLVDAAKEALRKR